jgi:hypothetical protein
MRADSAKDKRHELHGRNLHRHWLSLFYAPNSITGYT